MDMHENSLMNLVSATFELPGIKKEDIQLGAQDSGLIVSAVTKSSSEH
jgi:HSP20 family protein